MNSRERMLAAVRREPVDRVPTDIWATPEVWQALEDRFGDRDEVLDALHIDYMAAVEPPYKGPPLPPTGEDETINYWGIRRKRMHHATGFYDEQTVNPLALAATGADLDAYAWPTTDWFDYELLRRQIDALRQTRVVRCGYMAPFFYHNLLRGLEQSLMDPLVDPAFAHEVIGRISQFFYDHHRRIFETCGDLIDLADVTDDLGCQTGPLISPDLYGEFYAPHHKRFIDLCHEFGILVFHHDDGGIRPFIPLLIDMGINVLNPIQWTCEGMDLDELQSEFGGRICFHGAIDNQYVLPFGSTEEVRAEVRRCIDALASDGTGYILAPCHNLQSNTPVENIIAMYDEAWRYGARS